MGFSFASAQMDGGAVIGLSLGLSVASSLLLVLLLAVLLHRWLGTRAQQGPRPGQRRRPGLACAEGSPWASSTRRLPGLSCVSVSESRRKGASQRKPLQFRQLLSDLSSQAAH